MASSTECWLENLSAREEIFNSQERSLLVVLENHLVSAAVVDAVKEKFERSVGLSPEGDFWSEDEQFTLPDPGFDHG